jgi:pimeloyl-ACP methyl ester carboxylesterase
MQRPVKWRLPTRVVLPYRKPMTQPLLRNVQCISPSGLHRMAYKEWGEHDNPDVLLCIHGVTRVSDDFDALAEQLCHDFRVICPDVVGRGRSERLSNPMGYSLPQYVADMVTLIARLDISHVSLVGTSMGGLIGMLLASLPETPISRMVLNDVGPSVEWQAIARIRDYLGRPVSFATQEEGIGYVRMLSAPFGPHSEEQWRKLGADVLCQDEQGRWTRNYDLGIVKPMGMLTPELAAQSDAALWAAWDAIRCPVLVVRGEESDLLSRETVRQMQERGPRAKVAEIAGVGHAPTLMQPDQIAVVAEFLKA